MSTTTPPNKKAIAPNNRPAISTKGTQALPTSNNRSFSTNNSPNRPASTAPQPAQIQERAYRLWQSRGCPLGDDKHDWYAAERELSVLLGAKNRY